LQLSAIECYYRSAEEFLNFQTSQKADSHYVSPSATIPFFEHITNYVRLKIAGAQGFGLKIRKPNRHRL
jgi:hypothetical protein